MEHTNVDMDTSFTELMELINWHYTSMYDRSQRREQSMNILKEINELPYSAD
jgi:hypothetical protein